MADLFPNIAPKPASPERIGKYLVADGCTPIDRSPALFGRVR